MVTSSPRLFRRGLFVYMPLLFRRPLVRSVLMSLGMSMMSSRAGGRCTLQAGRFLMDDGWQES